MDPKESKKQPDLHFPPAIFSMMHDDQDDQYLPFAAWYEQEEHKTAVIAFLAQHQTSLTFSNNDTQGLCYVSFSKIADKGGNVYQQFKNFINKYPIVSIFVDVDAEDMEALVNKITVTPPSMQSKSSKDDPDDGFGQPFANTGFDPQSSAPIRSPDWLRQQSLNTPFMGQGEINSAKFGVTK